MRPIPPFTLNRRRFLHMLGAAGCLATLGAKPNLHTVKRTSRAFGTEVSLTLLHPTRDTAEEALDAALAEVERVDRLMSLYRPDSQIRRLNQAGQLDDADPLLLEILQKSLDISKRSDGAFDITVQPLWELYAAAKKQGALPDAPAIQSAKAKVDWKRIQIADRKIAFTAPGMAITLNGIAQGYAADRVLSVLRQHGIERALVNTGEIGALGRRADDQPWTVGIQHPRQPDAYAALAKLEDRCLATSGDYATTFTDDLAYNHIFDPATGKSPDVFSSVTVVSPSGAEADALATTLFVTGYEKGLKLLQGFKNAEAMFIWKDGRIAATRGFPEA